MAVTPTFPTLLAQYDALIERVYRYRMVIGQPDQEELLRMLHSGIDEGWLTEDDLAGLYINPSPYVWKREKKSGSEDS